MKWSCILVILFSVPLGPTYAESFKPSFNCSKASSPEETMICNSGNESRLAILDFLIADKYKFLMEHLPGQDATHLKKEQVEWLKNREIGRIREIAKESDWKMPFTDDADFLERYLENRELELTNKVHEITKADLNPGDRKTEINDQKMASKLLGTRNLSLQWLSWEKPGAIVISNHNGVYLANGEQEKDNGHLKMSGWISLIEQNYFVFYGTIETQADDIPLCIRKGRFVFAITQNRPYWRMQEMDNPCSGVTDYVDIYFAGPKKK